MSLFTSLSVAASGMSVQRLRTELLVENMANADTTRTPEGGPYRRKDVVLTSAPVENPFSSALQDAMEGTGVAVSEVVVDDREPERRYLPGHPDADKDGYVLLPRLNPAEEMVDLMSASRNFQANVSAMTAVKDMIHRSIDLMR